MKTNRVVRKDSPVEKKFRTTYIAKQVPLTDECVIDMWIPEFIDKLPEKFMWVIKDIQFTDKEYKEQFEEVE